MAGVTSSSVTASTVTGTLVTAGSVTGGVTPPPINDILLIDDGGDKLLIQDATTDFRLIED